MKSKFFFMLVLFLGIGFVSFSQSQSEAPATEKDGAAKTMTVDPAKGGDGSHAITVATADCKWVDANGDGICDTCGKKDCKAPAKSAGSSNCDPAACAPKGDAKPSGCCSSKGGKKVE